MSRLARTILLGTIAAAAGIWWLGRAYEVESSRLLGFLLTSALFVAAVILVSVVGGVAFTWLRRRLRRNASLEALRSNVKADSKDP